MIRKRHIGAAIIGALSGLLAGLPLSWIGGFIPQDGLPAPLAFSGTIWDGQIIGIPLTGPLEVKTRPGKILSGLPVSVQSQVPGISLRAEAGPGRVENLNFRGDLRTLPITDGRLMGLSGDIDVTIDQARFDGAACREISGTVHTDILARNAAKWSWQGPALAGPITCEKEEAVARLKGQDGMTDIELELFIVPDGQYRLDMSVMSRDNRAAALMPLYGFQPVDGRYRLTEQGRW